MNAVKHNILPKTVKKMSHKMKDINCLCSNSIHNHPSHHDAYPTKDTMYKEGRYKGHWQAKFHSSSISMLKQPGPLSGHHCCSHGGCGQGSKHANIVVLAKDKDWAADMVHLALVALDTHHPLTGCADVAGGMCDPKTCPPEVHLNHPVPFT